MPLAFQDYPGILELMQATERHARKARIAEFRFYRELNDFLPQERRQTGFRESFSGTPSVKDTIQAIGVPHSAIDLILVDGKSVGFAYLLRGGERVAVYPEFERLDISPVTRLRARPLRRSRFILDVHLGKLARYLRMLGFDAAYDHDWDDDEIISSALRDKRIILTRDLGILKQSRVTHGYWLRHHEPLEQLRETLAALDLASQVQPFTRCMECNGTIAPVGRHGIRGEIDEDIWARFDEFRRCGACHKIYWKGSHYRHMLALVEDLRE